MTEEIEELRSLLRSWMTTFEECSITSGVCCCGNAVEGHGHYDNHSAVDSGWYYAQSLYTETKEALAMNTEELEEQFVNLIRTFISAREGKGGIMLPMEAIVHGAFHDAMVTIGLYKAPKKYHIFGEKK